MEGKKCRQLTFQTCKGGWGVVPNVLDSLCPGPGPERRVKEASISRLRAAGRCNAGVAENATGVGSGETAIPTC